MILTRRTMASPLGPLRLLADGDVVIGIYLPAQAGPAALAAATRSEQGASLGPVLDQLERELGEYFAGHRSTFETPFDARGTPFQQAVWSALGRIAHGETTSYSRIAEAIGRPSAARAVGAAIGRNPLSIVVPCHRVVASDGALTGYAGGLPAKRWLLAMETQTPTRLLLR